MVPPIPPLSWSLSGALGPRRLVLQDLTTGSLRVLDLEERTWSEVSRPGRGETEFNRPGTVLSHPEGFLLAASSAHLIWFGQDLTPLRGRRLDEVETGPLVGSLFQLAVQPGMASPRERVSVYGYGAVDLDGPSRGTEWWVGWYRWRPSGEVDTLFELPVTSPAGTFYPRRGSYIAATSLGAYLLVPERQPYVLAVRHDTNEPQRLGAYPESARRVPEMPRFQGFDSVVRVMAITERLSYPAGLHALKTERGELLHLLYRRVADRKVTWELTRIDPVADRVLGTVTLPTDAPFVTLIPGHHQDGRARWAILEQGPVRAAQTQDTFGLILVDDAWLDARQADGKDVPQRSCTTVEPLPAAPAATAHPSTP